MSADDGIYIGHFQNNGKKMYAVVWTQAIDNLDYYKSLGGEELESYVKKTWGENGVFFSNLDKAWEYARNLEKEYRTEYGALDVGDLGASPL